MLALTIELKDHAEILQALANLVEWEELGLELGLLDTTLRAISKDQMKETKACKREMLAAWLQWQDNIEQKGRPSWRRLLDALKRINHAALAAEIERSTPWRQ